jgi:hypothetical protein
MKPFVKHPFVTCRDKVHLVARLGVWISKKNWSVTKVAQWNLYQVFCELDLWPLLLCAIKQG